MHDNQLDISVKTARDLIRAQFPEFKDDPVTSLAGAGTVNAIFRVGDRVTARFPLRAGDPLETARQMQEEAEAMQAFVRASPVAAPVPLGLGRPADTYPLPFALQSWIDGTPMTPAGTAASEALATDIADLIAALRRADTAGRSFDGKGRGGELPDHDAWVATCLDNSTGLLDVPALAGLWQRLRCLPRSGADVMSHKDLIPPNLLERGGRLTGVLDSGGFAPADPALDLVAAWHLFDAGPRTLIRARLGSTDVEWRRGAAWAFQQAIGLVWYYQVSNPAMSVLGRSTLNRLLVDPEMAAPLSPTCAP